MKLIKSIVAFVANHCGRTIHMANALDHKAMLYKLLGLEDSADETMVNERYNTAMKAPADEDAKKTADELKAANEAKTAAETLLANEKTAAAAEKARADKAVADLATANTAKTTAETNFANERKERAKLILDAAVTANKITGAKRKEYDAEFANVATFDATLAKLNAEKGTNLPGQRQAGMANIGSRRPGMTPEASKRQEQIANFVNEESKKPVYANLPDGPRYSRAYTAVMAAHPELAEETK